MTTPESENFDMNAVLRAATGRGQTTETEPSTTKDETSSNDEPEPELSMNDLIRRAGSRSYGNQMSNQARQRNRQQIEVFNDMIRSRARSGRQFSFGLPVSELEQ